MAKRLKTYRIDGDLDEAVAVKAAREGETVTEVITRALHEYLEPPAKTRPARLSGRKPPERPASTGRCPHRINPGSFCKSCGALI